MPIKLTSTQHKTIAIVLVVAALSLGISVKYFWLAFPEAAIDLRVNRDDSAPIALKFLSERGFRLGGYRHAAIFDFNDQAKLYLERTQGLERMNQLTRGPVRLWHWSHRWFKPQEKEEFLVEVTPAGEVAGFDHQIPEARTGANLDQASARNASEGFLHEVMKRGLGDLEFVEASTQKRPARTDHTFTWKQKSVNLGDGSLRLEVRVSGDQISGYREFVKIPEQWSRDYEELRSRNNAAQVIDEVFWILLSVAMLIVLVLHLRNRDVPVRLSLTFGLVAAVLVFLSQLNTFSMAEFGYSTADTYPGFIASYVIRSLLTAFGAGIFTFLLVAASEPVYREGFPSFLSLRRILAWRGLRTPSFLMANVVGLGMTFFFFAYQTVFYVAANRLGAWAPSEIPISDLLNTKIPWVAVLFGGFFPAVSEEMQFRAFAIPFLRKILRSLPLALVLASFNWGFLHSAYPNQPFFIRGVEVGVGGVIIGMIMLRFGVLATLIWHYSVDAIYTAFLLLRSTNPYLMVSGAITGGIMLVPLIIALIAYWRTGTFTEEEPLANAREEIRRVPHEVTAAEPDTSISYRPLSTRKLIVAGVVTLVFLALVSAPVYRFGRGIKLQITRSEAIATADNFLKQRNVSVADYRRVAWLNENVDPLALRYLLEHRPVQQSDQIYRQATRLLLWEVRYFRPLEKEEHRVYADVAGGEVFGYRHLLDEDAAGASLSPDQARALAETALGERGYRAADFELQDSQALKRKARQDYTFIWQARAGDPRNVDEERYRLQVDIAGDQVASFARFFKLPEDWERQRRANRLFNAISIGIVSLLAGGMAAGALILFVMQVRSGRIFWRASGKVGALMAAVTALAALTRLSTLHRNYDTSIPLATFHLYAAVGFLITPILAGLLGWFLVGLSTSLYPDAWLIFRKSARRMWRRDAAVAIAVSLVAAGALNRLGAWIASRFHAYAPVRVDLVPDAFNSAWPGLTFFFRAVLYGILYITIAAVVIYLVRWGLARRAWWIGPGGLLLLIALGPSSVHSVPEFLVGWVMRFLPLAVAAAIIVVFFRNNILAYAGVAFCLQVAEPVVSLISQPLPSFRWNGLFLVVLALIVLQWMLLPGKQSEP